MMKRTLKHIRAIRDYLKLPAAAKKEYRKDKKGLPSHDPGIKVIVKEGIDWLGRAQDNSLLGDGGVARYYSLLSGWSSSYPETTGYIIPTLVEYSKKTGNTAIFQRAKRMLDWLLSSLAERESGFCLVLVRQQNSHSMCSASSSWVRNIHACFQGSRISCSV